MDIKQQEILAPYTTFHIGGPAEFFVAVRDVAELQEALAWARARDVSVTVLGGGSNVLIPDEGIRGLVIQNAIEETAYNEQSSGVDVTVGAGVVWDMFVAEAVDRSLWGIENLSAIPGTVGGAVVQNINAYGVTIEEVVRRVDAVHIPTGTPRTFTPEECAFVYRNSFFKAHGEGQSYIITHVHLRLGKKPQVRDTYRSASQHMRMYFTEHNITEPSVVDVRNAITDVRRRIGMIAGIYKSAGSFFANPIVPRVVFDRVAYIVDTQFREKSDAYTPWYWELPDGTIKISAAFLMECTPFNKTDFRDTAYNETVGLSPVHTLSLINLGHAQAGDVQNLAREIVAAVHDTFGVTLHSEVCVL